MAGGPSISPTVVILSKNIDNLRASLGAVLHHEPGMRVIVVDDGLRERPGGALYARGKKPFCFSANCNVAIEAAGDADVVLLNDDAVLETPHGFTKLAQCAVDRPGYGVIAASTNVVGNPNQMRQSSDGFRDEPRMVCFICVFIPRAVINAVGLLDERFLSGGFEDDDYCLRARMAGFKIGVYDGCFVDHGSLKSTFRGDPTAPMNLVSGDQIFKDKWGVDNWGRTA